MDGMDSFALVLAGILEGKTRDTGGRLLGDDLDALDHSGNDFVFDAGIKSFGVLADNDQIYARIACRNMRQVADRPEVGEEFEALPEFDVDAGKAAADGRCHRALQSDASALNRLGEFFRNVFLVLFEGFGAGGEGFPFEFDAGSF